MVCRVGHLHGGILGLVDFLAEHGEAVEYDLIQAGLRLRWLGSELLTWNDLQTFIRGAPRTSAIGVAVGGEAALWGASEHLLAIAVDALHGANWQRAGNKHAPRPTPVSRPGVKPQGQTFGSEPIPISDFEEWWQQSA